MKKQEYHQRKVRFFETTQLDNEELKTRTIIALDKLGHQKFSTESGGYSLENWIRGVSLLLDEFEKKVGAAKLPSEYAEKRRELTDCLSKPVDLSLIDDNMSELKQNEMEVVRRFDEARERTASRIDELQNELVRCTAELEEEKRRLSSEAAEQHSRSFLRRLFGGNSTSPASISEDKTKELESRLRTLPSEILEQKKSRKSIDQRSSESPWAEEWRKLESLQVRLKELENERSKKIQLVREREEITASIASIISRISLGEDKTEGDAVSSG
jgi:uncharacterized protein with von Willebrand factor type A (vWA) domain